MDFWKKLELTAYAAFAVIVVIGAVIYYNAGDTVGPETNAETEQSAETPASDPASAAQANPFNL